MGMRRRLAQLAVLPLAAAGLAGTVQAPAAAADYEWTLKHGSSSLAVLVWRDRTNTLCVKRTGAIGDIYGSVRHPDGGWTTLRVPTGQADGCRSVSIREDYLAEFAIRTDFRPRESASWNGYT